MDRRKKVEARSRRKKRIRKKISGVTTKPRLCVYKSLKEIYVQLIDDSANRVITGASLRGVMETVMLPEPARGPPVPWLMVVPSLMA